MLYAFFDGDNIGDTLEILLTENKVQEARHFSRNVKDAFVEIEKRLREESDVEIVICGGDDLLIKYDSRVHNKRLLEDIMTIFEDITNHSMSCGVGENTAQAVRNLYLAKLYGKNRIKGAE